MANNVVGEHTARGHREGLGGTWLGSYQVKAPIGFDRGGVLRGQAGDHLDGPRLECIDP